MKLLNLIKTYGGATKPVVVYYIHQRKVGKAEYKDSLIVGILTLLSSTLSNFSGRAEALWCTI